MKLLLLGARGMLGTELRRALAGLGTVVPATRDGRLPGGEACEAADLDRPETLRALVLRLAPDAVVNAAAYTAVDRAQDEPAAAFRANAQAPGALAGACREAGALLVHYSTDYVFDGAARRPYREDDPAAPLGVYGASKLEGERAVLASGARCLLLRTAWVYAAHGRNFLTAMLDAARRGTAPVRVVDDRYGSPTPACLVAGTTARLLAVGGGAALPERSLFHLTASGHASWHGFAAAIFDEAVAAGVLQAAPALQAIAAADYPARAPRPAWSVLDNGKLRRHLDIDLPDWREALRGAMAEVARAHASH